MSVNPEAAAVKALVYLGLMLLVGGAVTTTWLARGSVLGGNRRLVTWLVIVGALALVAASLLEVVAVLHDVLGRVDGALVGRYLWSTQHGQVVRQRAVLAPIVAMVTAALAWWPAGASSASWLRGRPAGVARRVLRLVAFAASAWLLFGFSRVSHAAAMGGGLPLAADFVHLLAAALWAGPLGYLALLRHGEAGRGAMLIAFKRLSLVGLIAVIVLTVSGIYTALTHLSAPAAFARSGYGIALWVKLGLFALVVGAAAANRFAFMPRMLRDGAATALMRSVRVEAMLVVLIILATGALTTSALPHGEAAMPGAWGNLLNLIELLRR